MKRIWRFWQIVIVDTLGVILIVAALLIGWLPGPGGIPLFIIGLGLLALNHEWAQRYIDLSKKYADKLGDLVFLENYRVQLLYDILSPLMILAGILLLLRHSAMWIVSLGIFWLGMGITFLLGNRGRYKRLKERFR